MSAAGALPPYQVEHFTACSVLHDRALDARTVAWCPNMDLLALVGNDGGLTILSSFEGKKLVSKSPADMGSGATCAAWSPDGKTLALGHVDGALSFFDLEHDELRALPRVHESMLAEGEGGREVTALHWVCHAPPRAAAAAVAAAAASRRRLEAGSAKRAGRGRSRRAR